MHGAIAERVGMTHQPGHSLLVFKYPRNLFCGKSALLQEPHLPAALPEVPGQICPELFFTHLSDPLPPLIIIGLDTQADEISINTPLPQFGMNFLRPGAALEAGIDKGFCKTCITQQPVSFKISHRGLDHACIKTAGG